MDALIILKGKASIGKSGTLNQLIKTLADTPNSQLLEPTDITSAINNFAIVNYHGKNIGVITFGDPGTEDAVKNRLATCDNFNCDVVIAASRSYGAINNTLWQHAEKHNARVIQTEPLNGYDYSTPNRVDHQRLNQIAAENILRVIDYIIDENTK